MEKYIGITDFENAKQVKNLLPFFNNSDYKLMVGVMTSYKFLNDKETKWRDVWPKVSELESIFIDDERAYNTIHYADYKEMNLRDDLEFLLDACGPNLNAIQLDMVWPSTEVLNEIHQNNRNIDLILQINSQALTEVSDDAHKMIERVNTYGDSLSHVLLDRSMGKGRAMNAEGFKSFLRIIKEERPDLGLAVAGGLGPFTVGLVKPLVEDFPDLSIDAQGQIRSSGSALDPIEWTRAEKYIVEALKILQ